MLTVRSFIESAVVIGAIRTLAIPLRSEECDRIGLAETQSEAEIFTSSVGSLKQKAEMAASH